MPKYQRDVIKIQLEITKEIEKENARIKLIVVESLEDLLSFGGKYFNNNKNIILPNGNIFAKIANQWQLTENY